MEAMCLFSANCSCAFFDASQKMHISLIFNVSEDDRVFLVERGRGLRDLLHIALHVTITRRVILNLINKSLQRGKLLRTLFMGILYYLQKNNVVTPVIVENERGSYQVRCDNQLILTAAE